jgi:hypothetical protein
MPASEPLKTGEVCYLIAYFILPSYIAQAPDKLFEHLSKGNEGAVFLYVVACQQAKRQPMKEEAFAFSLHEGDMETGQHYWIVQYPTPPPVNFSKPEFVPLGHPDRKVVLAPYFSAVLRNRNDNALSYYILGQAPFGGTTLRSVSGSDNSNLGPGCEPEVGAFIRLVTERQNS